MRRRRAGANRSVQSECPARHCCRAGFAAEISIGAAAAACSRCLGFTYRSGNSWRRTQGLRCVRGRHNYSGPDDRELYFCRLTRRFHPRLRAPVKQFGVALTFGMPRFFVDLGGIATLDRRGQLWVHAAPLIARLGLFCFGMLLWFTLRQSASSSAHLALVVGQIGLLAFLLTAQPLWPSDGYRWLVTYFGRPTLRAEALGRMPEAASRKRERRAMKR